MYRLELVQQDQWAILDERDEDRFRGSLSACEQWLDALENQKPNRKAFAEFHLRDWILQCLAGVSHPAKLSAGSNVTAGQMDK